MYFKYNVQAIQSYYHAYHMCLRCDFIVTNIIKSSQRIYMYLAESVSECETNGSMCRMLMKMSHKQENSLYKTEINVVSVRHIMQAT